MSLSISIIIFISTFIYISISIIIFSLVIQFAGGKEPELIRSVLKLLLCARGMAGSRSRKSKLPKEQIGFLRGATASEGGRAALNFFLLGFKGSAKFKMLAGYIYVSRSILL